MPKKEVDEIWDNYNMGLITNNERYNQIIDRWTYADSRITDNLMKELAAHKGGFNSVYMMLHSGARGSKQQIKQLCGLRGLMAKPRKSGDTGSAIIENQSCQISRMDFQYWNISYLLTVREKVLPILP